MIDGANLKNPFWYLHYVLSYIPGHPSKWMTPSKLISIVKNEIKRETLVETSQVEHLKFLVENKRIFNRLFKKQVLEIYSDPNLYNRLLHIKNYLAIKNLLNLTLM